MSRRLEFIDETSSKFWEVEVVGDEVTTRWGRIGTAGQSKSKTYASESAARLDADAQLAKKLKGGYLEVAVVASVTPSLVGAVASVQTSVPEAAGSSKPALKDTEPKPETETAVSTNGASAGAPPENGKPDWRISLRAQAWPWREWKESAGPAVRDGHIPDMKSWQAGLGVCVPSLIAPQKEAVEILRGGPPSADPSVNAVLLVIAPQALGKVLAGGGAVGALQALAGARELGKLEHRQGAGSVRWVSYKGATFLATPSGSEVTSLCKRLRHHLAVCAQAEYQAAVEWAVQRREKADLQERLLLAVVLPDQGWAEEEAQACLKATVVQWGATSLPEHSFLLLASLRDVALATQLCQTSTYAAPEPEMASNLLVNLGRQAFPLIFQYMQGSAKAEWSQSLWSIEDRELADGLRAFLENRALRPKVSEYYLRFPEPGIPALARAVTAGGKHRDTARTILNQALRSPGELPTMEPRELAVCQGLRDRFPQNQVEAGQDELPPVLVAPPWKAKKRSELKPVVAQAAAPPAYAERIVWEGSAPKGYFYEVPPPDNVSDAGTMRQFEKDLASKPMISVHVLDRMTDANALRIWSTTDSRRWYEPWAGLTPIVARFGLAALPGLLTFAEHHLHAAAVELQRFDTPRVAGVMSVALAGIKSKGIAKVWMQRFPQAALLGLIPVAVGPTGKGRGMAEEALRWIASWAPREEIERVAEALDVLVAVRSVLDFDPLLLLPKKLPALPDFLDPTVLPRPLLKNGKALPLEAVGHLLSMLTFSPQSPAYSGVLQVREICQPDSLEEFAWEVYSLWHTAGGPPKEKWAMWAVAHLGGDECARRLAPLIRVWPQEQLFSRAEQGLDVLAAIGSDVALMHIYQMSQKLKSKALQQRAATKLDEIAQRRGLTSEELADRLVSDLDLESDGSCSLSFGPRAFRVVFDEQLRPGLRDSQGKPIKELPKPAASDDAAAAAAAVARWKALKKDAKTLGQGQLLRLELAMSSRRRWPGDAWSLFLLNHPLLVHLVRRLLWGAYSSDGQLLSCFRVAEDASLATVEDDPYTLDLESLIGIPHPLELAPQTLAAWSAVFQDYEILQPFPQLGRPVLRLTEAEMAAKELTRQSGRKVHPGKIVGLESRGWRRGETWDGGVCCEMLRPMGDGRWAHLEFADGLYLGALHESGEQTLGSVSVREKERPVPLGELDEILISELLADLEGVR